MKLIYTLTLILFANIGYSQSSALTINKIYKMFTSSIDQSSKKVISVGTGEWLICNSDSAFYKKDTIKMYNNINYFYQQNSCCKFIGWTFYKKDAFVQSDSQICNEPASRLAKSDNFKIKLSVKNKCLFMLISNPKSVINKFEILELGNVSLANNQFTQVLTLKRIDP